MDSRIKDLGERIQAAASKHGVALQSVDLAWTKVPTQTEDVFASRYLHHYEATGGWRITVDTEGRETAISVVRKDVYLGGPRYDGSVYVVAEETRPVVTAVLGSWRAFQHAERDREQREWAAARDARRREAEEAARRACFD